MRNTFLTVFIVFLAVTAFFFNTHAADLTFNNTPARVYFTPHSGVTRAIVKEIDNASMEILVQAYSLSSSSITKALVNAKRRGVEVSVIFDKNQKKSKRTAATALVKSDIPVYFENKYPVAGSNVMIIDKETVITGSSGFTKTAEKKNTGDLLIIKSKELANMYIDNWYKQKKHSQAYRAK